MTTATAPVPVAPATPPRPRSTLADLLRRLGDVPPDRVRSDPAPGHATLEDLIWANEARGGPTCEWVDSTLVEKAMGYQESRLAMLIGHLLLDFLEANDIGTVSGPDGVMNIVVADVTGHGREDKVPAVVPDLAIEVLSASNTPAEMARKRDEYFRAGVKRVWEIDPESRSANAFTGPNAATPVPADGTLDGETVLPGFTLSLRDLFARAERR